MGKPSENEENLQTNTGAVLLSNDRWTLLKARIAVRHNAHCDAARQGPRWTIDIILSIIHPTAPIGNGKIIHRVPIALATDFRR
jgi:hypothetical protein